MMTFERPTQICIIGHATPDPSPPYKKAPKGYNSIDDDDIIFLGNSCRRTTLESIGSIKIAKLTGYFHPGRLHPGAPSDPL